MSCDEHVALFMRESITVRDSFGSCGHNMLSICEVNFIVAI